MRARFSSRPNHATVVAYLALFVALGGGAYAATSLPKHSVGTKQLRNGAVTSAKLHKGAVNGSKVANKSLTGAQINAATLGTVPNAMSAGHATTADTAASATNSAKLGGSPASAYLTPPVGPAQFGTLPAVRATNSTTESIPDSVTTTLTFDTNDYDEGGLHSTTSNTSRLTAPVSGVYEVVGNVHWPNNSTGVRQLFVKQNGTTVATNEVGADPAGNTAQGVTTQVRLNAGDYVELQAFQSSGTTLDVLAFVPPEFSMHWAGP